MSTLIRCFLSVLILVPNLVAASGAACSSSNDFSLGEHPPKPSLGIRLFELKVQPEFPMRTMEHLRIFLAEKFRARLAESGYFGTVSLLAEDSEEPTDFTMIGAFTQASIGTNGFSLYNVLTQEAFDKPSTVTVVGGILRGKDEDPATTFQCQLGCCRIPVMDGVPVSISGTGIRKSEAAIAKMADDLNTVYRRMGRTRARAGEK
ncbi:MAG: hypothetical protein ACLQVL_11715 [Terriglobia bacterium]